MAKYKKTIIGLGLILGILLVALWGYYQVIMLPALAESFPVTPCPATPACMPDPEGQQIVFSSNPIVYDVFNMEARNIYTMSADGTCTQQLTDFTMREPYQPQWSPDGGQILFEVHFTNDVDLYTVTPTEDPQVTRLTWQGRNYAATWSPDGSQIAFVSNRTGYDAFYLMEADGTGERLLSDIEAVDAQESLLFKSIPVGVPHWSPDGQQLAFTGVTPGTGLWDIYLINGDGSSLTNLTNSRTDASLMAWLPAENELLFSQHGSLFTMNPDGTNVQLVLTEGKEKVDEMLGWTPTSPTRLIFSMADTYRTLRLVDLACSKAHPTTFEDMPTTCYYEIQEPNGPMVSSYWSAGDPQLLFSVRRMDETGDDIFTLNYDGTGLTNLTNCSSIAEDPAWSPPP